MNVQSWKRGNDMTRSVKLSQAAAKRLVSILLTVLLAMAGSAVARQDPVPACAECSAKFTKGPEGRWTIVHEKWCKHYSPPPTSSRRSGGEAPPASATASPSTAVNPSRRALEEAESLRRFEEEKEKLIRGLKGGSAGSSGMKTGAAVDLRLKGSSPAPEVLQEQKMFEQNNPVWKENQRLLVRQRLEEPNPFCSAILTSLKAKIPPLPGSLFDKLKSGDVLLFEANDFTGKAIMYGDRLLSRDPRSPLSHTLIYLKEINGKKLFLDNTPGRGKGSRIILEDEVRRLYGDRQTYVAQLVQPLKKEETEKLYAAAKELALKERTGSHGILDGSHYGVRGGDMVCSEVSRWALLRAGRNIEATGSLAKRLLSIEYSPADFFSNNQDFLVIHEIFFR